MTRSPITTGPRNSGRGAAALLAATLAAAAFALVLIGCQSLGNPSGESYGELPGGEAQVAVSAKTGVQLWAENCGRCHNVRDPGTYSDAQWDVAMLHMRTRANLSADDYRAIREFILSAN